MLTLRGRWMSLLGAFLAAAVGVGVVALSTLLFASGKAPVPDRLAAAAVIVRSPAASVTADPFPEARPWSSPAATGLAARLAAIPGVAAAIPDRVFYAQPVLDGRPDESVTLGQGWAGARLGGAGLVAGAPPQGDRDLVLGRTFGRSPGDRVTLLTAAGPAEYTVSGVVDGAGVFLSDATAERVAPGVRAIGLVLAPDVDTAGVASAAERVTGGDGQVLTGDGRSALEPRADARTRWIGMQVLTALAALSGFVTVFVVASTFAFTVAQRRRELGLLRAIGATPRQVRRMLYGEALAVGAAASVAGLAVGAALAPALGAVLVDAGFEPASYRVRFEAWPVAVSLAAGPVVALLGVWSASRRAGRARPLEALREAIVEDRRMGRARWAAGLSCAALGLALAAGTATSDDAQNGATFALYGAMALVLAAAALAPAVVPPVVRLLTWPLGRVRGATGMLAREGALTAPRRTAGTAAPVLLTVAFAVMVSGMVATSANAYAARRAAAVETGTVVVPDGTPGLPDTAGRGPLESTVYTGERPLSVSGVDRPGAAISRGLADQYGWSVGQSVPMVFADGETVPVRVGEIVDSGLGQVDMQLPRDLVRAHDPSALAPMADLRAAEPAPAGPGIRVVDVATYAAEADTEEDRLIWIFALMLVGVSAGYGALAVANTLLMSAVHRVRDFAVLRLAGATRWQVALAAAAESALVVAIGTLLGGAVAVAALVSIRAGLSEQVRAPVDLVVPWPVVGGVVGLCLLLAVLAAAVPARGISGGWTARRSR
ncbi:ABC transporter permease [Phytohabitans aurantiacus]|uniref:ABC transporter permease n=1 Tax=Phytohabitans aurantiacus TaxID=3016789 RepID=A0ABQ5R888_9ACTN|nr:ABC transporter permease [Phytohabitans aurantiacus]GLI02418.1 ABC transporter permease [Phytohabitans aurantiacus]